MSRRGNIWLQIKVFLVYVKDSISLIKEFVLISKPGGRIFWSLNTLFLNFNKSAFSGFYIISTTKGLYSSSELIWRIPTLGKLSGEVLLKISF
jgi:ribosomal protein S8